MMVASQAAKKKQSTAHKGGDHTDEKRKKAMNKYDPDCEVRRRGGNY
jgi:hypothetical protein